MESNQQVVGQTGSQIRQANGSNVFQSRLYDSINFQPSTVHQNQVYDSQYRTGFPKLYSFDTSVQNKSRISLDQRGKYSFRNDYSKIVEQNTLLIRQNTFLREEITRLTTVIQVERRSGGNRAEIDRLNALLIQRDNEIRALKERIFVLQNQGSKTNEWQLRFNESQNTIAQLNSKIASLNQQLSQYEGQFNQFNIRISQYESQINQFNVRSSQYEQQINELNVRLNQYRTQINQLNVQIKEYTTRINQLQRQAPTVKTDPQAEQLRNQIYSLTAKLEQYQLQISQYEKTFSQYESQISSLQEINWRLEERITRESKIQSQPQKAVATDNEQWIFEQGKLNFRIIILLQEINRLKQREQQLVIKAQELHAYLLKAENYIEEIQLELEKNNLKENIPTYIVEKVTLLEQQNAKYALLIKELQSRLSVTQVNGVPEDEHYAKLGERDFRIIILLEEINRLNQKVIETRKYLQNAQNYIEEIQRTIEQRETVIPPEVEAQLTYLSEENHRLNILIQNYIEEIKNIKPTQPQIEYQIPPEIQNKVAFLAQENERLNAFIIELERRPPVQIPSAPIIEYQIPPEIENRLAFLAQENERLTKLVIQLQNRTVIVAHPASGSEQLEADYAKAKFRVIILLQEINRLNHSLKEVSSYLVNAENFIQELEIRLQNQQSTFAHSNVESAILEQMQQEIARMTLQKIFLLEEINRLNHVVKEIHSHLINAESYIEQCEIRMHQLSQTSNKTVEFQIPPEIENRLAFLAQQNERLTLLINEIQSRPARVETRIEHKVQFKIPPEIEKRITLLANENQRLEKLLSQKSQSTNDESTFQIAKLRFRIIILLQEINRLNFVSEQLRQNLINAQNYIYEFENRPPQVAVPAEVQNQIFSLRTENQNLHAELNRISLEYEQQISLYKTEISSINIQLSTFRSEATTYKSRYEELERKSVINSGSSQTQNQLNAKLATEHFRIIILLEEINRLNHKLNTIDAQRVEVIGHLVNAQNYIQDLQVKLSIAEGSKQETITNNTAIQGSNSAIIELNSQLVELQNRGRIEIAQKDLRIIFLLQEINRLNHKVESLSTSQGSDSSSQVFAIQQAKQQTERQLQQVLSHLRQAEEYIGQIVRDNENLIVERDHLINELNRSTGAH